MDILAAAFAVRTYIGLMLWAGGGTAFRQLRFAAGDNAVMITVL